MFEMNILDKTNVYAQYSVSIDLRDSEIIKLNLLSQSC